MILYHIRNKGRPIGQRSKISAKERHSCAEGIIQNVSVLHSQISSVNSRDTYYTMPKSRRGRQRCTTRMRPRHYLKRTRASEQRKRMSREKPSSRKKKLGGKGGRGVWERLTLTTTKGDPMKSRDVLYNAKTKQYKPAADLWHVAYHPESKKLAWWSTTKNQFHVTDIDQNGIWHNERDPETNRVYSWYGKGDNIVTEALKPVSNSLSYIWGPISFYYFKIPMGNSTKKIILMGDDHSPLVEHIPFKGSPIWENSTYYDKFIVNLIEKLEGTNQCVDLYLESQLTLNQSSIKGESAKRLRQGISRSAGLPNYGIGSEYQSIWDMPHKDHLEECERINQSLTFFDTLQELNFIFYKCGSTTYGSTTYQERNAEECMVGQKAFNNLRVQNIDLRGTSTHTMLLFPFKSDISIWECNILLEWFLDIEDHDISHLIKDETSKGMEDLKKLKTKLQNEITKFKENSGLSIDVITSFLFDCYLDESIYSLTDVLFSRSPLMDLYTITRMLKSFKTDKNKSIRGPLRCRNSNDQNNIIMYAGNAHIDKYVCLLKKLFPGALKFEIKSGGFKLFGIPIGQRSKISKCISFERYNTNTEDFANFDDIMRDFCKPVMSTSSDKFN